ncbi:MAG: hypothetical protein D6698_10525 [Gammaproteobacteria bacterium]|nr:MAG: hypothetical protein D6698_10525 [Gammaproteobacteria bacterium]
MAYKTGNGYTVERFHYLGKLTTTERLNLTTPDAGIFVFDTTENRPYAYDGTTWHPLGGAAGGGGISADAHNSLKLGSDLLPYLTTASSYVPWGSASQTTVFPNPYNAPVIFDYYGAGTSTLTITQAPPAYDSANYTLYFFVVNSGGNTLTLNADTGVTLNGDVSVKAGEAALVIYGDPNTANSFLIKKNPITKEMQFRTITATASVVDGAYIPFDTMTSLDFSSGNSKIAIQGGGTFLLQPGVYKLTAKVTVGGIVDAAYQWYNHTLGFFMGTEGFDRKTWHSTPAVAYVRATSAQAVGVKNISGATITFGEVGRGFVEIVEEPLIP